jgi:uncharacterized protein
MEIEPRDSASLEQAETLLKHAPVIRLALAENNEPYLVPVSFGYQDGAIYIHSGNKGKKLAMLRANPRVCFEIDEEVGVVPGSSACKFNMTYKSLIGYGNAEILTADAEKRRGLDAVVRHYGAEPPVYAQDRVDATVVVKITIESTRIRKV